MDPVCVPLLGKCMEEVGRRSPAQGVDAEVLWPGPGVAPLQGCSEGCGRRQGSRGEVGRKT